MTVHSPRLAVLGRDVPPANIPDDGHPKIRQIVEYWTSIHPSQGLPGRRHFDPRDVTALLAYLGLVDVVGDPPRFRIRLFGTRLVDFFGRDLTGEWYDEVFDGFHGSRSESDFLTCMATGQPSWRRGQPLFVYEKDFRTVERVFLPLAADGRNIDMFLNMLVFGFAANAAD